MTFNVAFFLSDKGDLIHVADSHISTVIADSERFGLTKEEIQTVYDRHGEKIGAEGEARKELLLRIVAECWIRMRRYPNKYWSITAPSFSPVVQGYLRDWAEKMLAGTEGFKEIDRYMPVKIDTSEGQTYSTIGELVDGSCPPYEEGAQMKHN